MRSGFSAATFSNWMPSTSVSTSGGVALPSLSFAHGQTAPGYSPNHSVVATGTTPSASSASCSTRPTTTTRFGSAVISVVPYLCSIDTGKADVSAPAVVPPSAAVSPPSPPPHAARPVAVTRASRALVNDRLVRRLP